MWNLVSYGLLAPPTLFIVLCLLGALSALVWRRTGIAVALVSSFCFFVAAIPAFSSYLLQSIESIIPESSDLSEAQAIVVLGAEIRSGNPPMPNTLGLLSLERVFLAAKAYRQLHLPVAVSGGVAPGTDTAVAVAMKSVLEGDFGVPVSWVEDRSRTTYENALYTAQLLSARNIKTVVVISQARDLPRAIWSFERVGLHALPWPVPRTTARIDKIEDLLPNVTALQETYFALHELMGGIYYRLRY
jgi:uncharacterized SAM-binding protein YcdF (DUF218 family)